MIRSLGRYEILSELGRGAMGVVYLAKDPKIDRTVAIKCLRLGLVEEDKSAKGRFQQEVHALGRLIHQNIVSIFDTGEDPETGNPYIVTEYVAGMSLAQRLREGPALSIGQACRIGAQLCEALDFAHEQRIVHRDIKPGNILISPDLKTVKLTDFGIAKLETGAGLTQTNQLVGTPRYMSPEQCRAEAIDGRSDLFSVGAVLYEMVTGHKAFPADELAATMLQVITLTPPAPREVSKEVPAVLSDVIMKALEKSPLKRFMSGKEMAEALRLPAEPLPKQRHAKVDTLTMDRPAAAESTLVLPSLARSQMEAPSKKKAGRSRAVAAIGVVAVVAIVGGWGGWEWYNARPRPTSSPTSPQTSPDLQPLITAPLQGGVEEETMTAPKATGGSVAAVEVGRVVLSTVPLGATVTIDGKEYGTTPLTVELPAGSHDLEVAKEGYYLVEASMEVVERETVPVDLTLKKEEESP